VVYESDPAQLWHGKEWLDLALKDQCHLAHLTLSEYYYYRG
jgi:hypothetical protein